MPPARLAALVLAPLLACAEPPIGETGGESSSGSSSGSSSSGDAPTTDADASTGSSGDAETGTTDPGFDPPTPACGNGYLEADEECDDANTEDGDACTAACQIPCGLEREWIELAPTAESDIAGLRVVAAPDGGIVVVGRIQEVTVDQEGNPDAGPLQGLVVAYDAAGDKRWERRLGPDMGDLELRDGAVDAAGDIALVGTIAADDKRDIWVARLAAEDGAELWSVTVDGELDGSDDLGTGVAVAPDGDVVATGQVRNADKDDDIWVRKLAAADGAPVWTTTWSGTADNGFSTDDGGPVAVAADGSVYVLVREYVDFETAEATLLKFGDDGDPLWEVRPLADGSPHEHDPGAVATSPEGEPLIVVQRFGAAPTFWVYRYTAMGEQVWALDRGDFEVAGEDWSAEGLGVAADGEVVIGGSWLDDVTLAKTEWYEAWIARLEPDGTKRCQVSYRAPGEDLVPPSLLPADFAAGPEGTALAAGARSENGEASLWTGRFRPL
jgi:cysteine-rich repeat protein